MIEGLKHYPTMKDSGVLWLGNVPEHWQIRKLRYILRRVTERNQPDLPLLSVVREKGVIRRDTTNAEENRNFIPDDLSNYKVVRVAQFAMNKMKAWQGSYGVSQFDGIVSPAYFVFDVTGVEGLFFHSAIRSRAYVPSFTQASDGVRIGQWDLAEARMREIAFVVPPLAEQDAIVRFLDHANRRIERYIQAKKKLVILLNEQKQGIIHRVVTRGLDSNVRLKSSGISWLGDIPEHWQRVKLGMLARVTKLTGFEYTSQWVPDPNGEIIALRGFNIKDRALNLEYTERISSSLSDRLHRSKLRSGDIVMPCTGTLGHAALITEDNRFHINQNIAKISVSENIVPDFLVYMLTSPGMKVQIELNNSSGLQPVLLIGTIRNLDLQLPPISEQMLLVEYLMQMDRRTTRLIDVIEKQIALFIEYLKALTSYAVTGKIDVRDLVANLPNEPVKVDSLDETETGLEKEAVLDESDFEAELVKEQA